MLVAIAFWAAACNARRVSNSVGRFRGPNQAAVATGGAVVPQFSGMAEAGCTPSCVKTKESVDDSRISGRSVVNGRRDSRSGGILPAQRPEFPLRDRTGNSNQL